LTGFPYLAADCGFWVDVLADLVECSVVGVRLASVDSGMCARLHVDHVSVRIVSTYVGPGTQYVENGDVDRRLLAQTDKDASDESSGVLLPSALIHAASSGDIVLLKGERWPRNAGGGAVHRSPMASATRPRLVLTLDPLWN
jgi:hypothetical protein